MSTPQGRIPLPRIPQLPAPVPFPILAFLAPIIAAALMWALTRSPFVLMFAFLGPVVALATMGDARRRAHMDWRQQQVLFGEDYVNTLRAIDAAHESERTERDRRVPPSTTLVASPVRDSERWRLEEGEYLNVRLGTGRLPSSVTLEEGPSARPHAKPGRARTSLRRTSRSKVQPIPSLEELRTHASTLTEAPVIVDARWGIGVCGPRAEGVALANSIAVQLAAGLSPLATQLHVKFDSATTLDWAHELPHFVGEVDSLASKQSAGPEAGHFAELSFHRPSGRTDALLCVSDDEFSLPRDCRVVISVAGSRARIVRHPEAEFPNIFVPDYISDRQARRFAITLKRAARDWFANGSHSLPERVAFCDLISTPRPESVLRDDNRGQRETGRASLAATVGVGVNGPVTIDLVADGPHAIIGGTTGSGKSEVLVTWVLALAARFSPTDVNFLLVDFKGGAAFAPVQRLPHTVGVLTDLDPPAARRAILSLQAELRRREQILAAAHARSISELPHDTELPRLLIIVDEFAAMVTSFIDMHDLFADLAARGRSLGIHLILCTQRPAGTIRDAILANCTLRVSLRVNNSADSIAVVGSPDAAQIPKEVPGRCLLQRGGCTAESVQWAMAGDADARDMATQFSGHSAAIRRPWLDPLPVILDHRAVPRVALPAVAFGLTDIPEEQRQVAAVYDPIHDGNLVIVGSHRSGKSTLLATIAATERESMVVPSNPEGAWDAVTELLDAVRAGSAPSLVLVDDLDLILGRFGPEHESAFVDRLMMLAREAPRVGTALVFTASVVRGRVQTISALCTSTLVLRMRDKHDHVLVGGEQADFCAELPSGGGFWRGHRIQVTFSTPLPPLLSDHSPNLECAPGETIFVVSPRPTAVRGRLEVMGKVVSLDVTRALHDVTAGLRVDRGLEPTIVLGDPDAWLSQSTLFGSQRTRGRLVFHDCSLTEFRSLARSREIPPPVDSSLDTVVVLHPDGRMNRALLPSM